MRNVFSAASKITAKWVGASEPLVSCRNFHSMLQPDTAQIAGPSWGCGRDAVGSASAEAASGESVAVMEANISARAAPVTAPANKHRIGRDRSGGARVPLGLTSPCGGGTRDV